MKFAVTPASRNRDDLAPRKAADWGGGHSARETSAPSPEISLCMREIIPFDTDRPVFQERNLQQFVDPLAIPEAIKERRRSANHASIRTTQL
jgi:hypothetical protein